MRLVSKIAVALRSRLNSIAAKTVAFTAERISGFKTRLFLVATAIVGIGAYLSFETQALGWLPKASEPEAQLGPLLGAQAAIAALTLAVTLFVMQGVSNRRDADDRMYREYVSRSWVRDIFWLSIAAVGLTGGVLLAEKFVSATQAADAVPGLGNLTFMAVFAFLGNLALAVALFERALRLAHPDEWRRIRRHVNMRDVRNAVQAFVRRYQRVKNTGDVAHLDWSDVLPDPVEGSADEAINNLLDDARRAMVERRLSDFEQSLSSIRELTTYAMEELKRAEIEWGAPGAQPDWPPLSELSRSLRDFREDITRQGSREHVAALLSLDHWFLSHAVKTRCGELFTFGLQGHRWNYMIAARVGNRDLRELFRERVWLAVREAMLDLTVEESLPYMSEMNRYHERLLSDALHFDLSLDYERLQRGFETFRRFMNLHWNA